jgi:hypothetical protein
LPDVFTPNTLLSGQTSKLIPGSRGHIAPPVRVSLLSVFASADDDESLLSGTPPQYHLQACGAGQVVWNSHLESACKPVFD